MSIPFDGTLYLVTDKKLARGRPLELVVQEAIDGGITALQLREKRASTKEFLKDAFKIKEITDEANIPLIINDRVDVALAVGAAGVHLGQEDLPIEVARDLLGPDAIIGISVTNTEQAKRAEGLSLSYVGVGPVHFTLTKEDGRPAIGYEGLESIASLLSHPIVAIGGIKTEHIGAVIEAGAQGVAVVSAIMAADAPRHAAQELLNGVRQARALHAAQ